MELPPTDFESAASASSAIPAIQLVLGHYIEPARSFILAIVHQNLRFASRLRRQEPAPPRWRGRAPSLLILDGRQPH
jgi:hypothetical protein